MKYDEATEQFLRDAVTIKEPTKPSPIGVRQALGITQALVERNPGALVKGLAGRGIASLASRELNMEDEKTAAVDPVTINALEVFVDLEQKYGHSWQDWEPETVAQTLLEDYGITLSEDGVNIVGALQVVLNTNYAMEHWHVFEKVGHAFNTNVVDFTVLQPLEPHEISLTYTVIGAIRRDTDYEPEISSYVASAAKNAGMVYLPIQFFRKSDQDRLDELNNDLMLKGTVKNILEGAAKAQTEEERIQLARIKEVEEYVSDTVKTFHEINDIRTGG